MYIHTSLYIIERLDERLAHMKGAEMTDKDLFAKMAQSIMACQHCLRKACHSLTQSKANLRDA
jgi:hypothetical protein